MIQYLFICLVSATSVPSEHISFHARSSHYSAISRANSLQGRNAINGLVFGDARRPVSELRVELLDENDSVFATSRTNGSGMFTFYGLVYGTYQVRVLTHGTNYISQTERVNIAGPGAQNMQVNFALRSKESATSPKTPGGTVFAQEVPDAARKSYEKALKNLADESRNDAGLTELKTAIDLFPSYYAALERLGTEYVKRQQYELAQPVLVKAVEVNPRGHQSLFALGVTQFNLKDKTAAIDSLRRAIAQAPTSVNAHLWLGIVLLKDGKSSEAETSLKQAYMLGGSRIPDVHMYLAQLYSNSKRYKEAATELELYLQEAPNARDADSIRKLIKQLLSKAG